jgi:FlaA1/EpsC-like NDP-sugar epimerase
VTEHRYSLLNYAPFLAAIDLLMLLGCSWLVLVLTGTPGLGYLAAWWHLLPAQAICALLVLWAFGLYRAWYRRPLADLEILIAVSVGVMAAVWMLLCRWEPNYAIPGSLIVGMTLLQGIALTCERMLIRAIIHRSEIMRRVVVIAADKKDAAQVIQTLLFSARRGSPSTRLSQRRNSTGYRTARLSGTPSSSRGRLKTRAPSFEGPRPCRNASFLSQAYLNCW